MRYDAVTSNATQETIYEIMRRSGQLETPDTPDYVPGVDGGGGDLIDKLVDEMMGTDEESVQKQISLRYNSYIYKNLSSSALGFCFDCGHAHCYTPDENPLEMFASYISTTHIQTSVH